MNWNLVGVKGEPGTNSKFLKDCIIVPLK